MQLTAIYIVQLMLIGGALSHSWIACTDYLQENGDYWDHTHCRAYARGASDFTPKTSFGLDRGFDYHPSEEVACRPIGQREPYTSDYPSAVYYPGQKVVIAHPTKNHVAASCTNKYIPDHGNYILRSEVNPSADPKLSEFQLVADLGISPFGHEKTEKEINTYPKPGYQNAPKFCENNDKALATSAFYIPPDLPTGNYTFLWTWSFNGANDLYSSCWEVNVVNSKSARNRLLRNRGFTAREPDLLHDRSLAKLPSGSLPTQPGSTTPTAPSTASPSVIPTSKAPADSTTTAGVSDKPQSTQAPCKDCIPSTLTCIDSCMRSCYNSL